MPRKTFRKTKKSARRRRYKSKVPRQLIPTKTVKTFKYQTTIELDPSAVSSSAFYFRANGMYDPEVPVGGHQPLGFDEYLGVLYDHFTVIGCKITCDFASDSSSTSGSYIVGLTPTDTSGVLPISVSTIIEQGRSVYRQVQPYTSGHSLVRLRHKMNPPKFLGRGNPMSDPELKGNSAGDPTEQAMWAVWCASMNGTTDPAPLTVNCLLEYVAVLTEPKILPAS